MIGRELDGRSFRKFIQRRLGNPGLTQCSTFMGSRSILRHILDWMGRLAQLERKVTVIVKSFLGDA